MDSRRRQVAGFFVNLRGHVTVASTPSSTASPILSGITKPRVAILLFIIRISVSGIDYVKYIL